MKNPISRVRASSLAACAASVIVTSAGAALSYSTSFESPFTVGNLAGQQTWVPTASGSSSLFKVANTAGQARTGSQFVSVDTSSFSNNSSIWAWKDTPQTAADLSAEPIITASVWVKVASGTAGATRVSAAGIDAYDVAGSGRLGAMRLGSDGKLVLINSVGVSASVTLTGYALNTWYNLSIDFDFGADKLRWYINGSQIDTSGIAGFDAFTATNFGDADLYAVRAAAPSGTSTGSHVVAFDDFSVVSTPGPGAIALLGVAGLVGARRRR